MALESSIDKMEKLGYINPDLLNSYEKVGVQFETAQQAGLPSSLINSNPPSFNPREPSSCFPWAWRAECCDSPGG